MTAFIMINVMSCMNEDSVVQEVVQEADPSETVQNELFSAGIAIGEMYGKPGFRELVYSEVDKKFDGDFNVLVTNLEKNYPEKELLKSGRMEGPAEYFRKIGRYPQIYIPFYEELSRKKKLGKQDPVFLIYSDENESGKYEGYVIDRNGGLTGLGFLIDEDYAMENEVWVISLNERVDSQGNVVYENPVQESILRCAGEGPSTGQTETAVLKSACGCASPPKTPTNVQTHPLLPRSVNIRWQDMADATYYKIYRSYEYSGVFSHIATVDSSYSAYTDNYLTAGKRYDYKVRAYKAEDCYSPASYETGVKASWRTNDKNEILYQIYITDRCWNWCCSWPEGDIELVYRIVKYNKTDQQVEYPKKSLPTKSKSQQKGRYCLYTIELFRWDVYKYAYNYMLFFYEDDGGDDKGTDVKLSAKFSPGDNLSLGADISFTIDDRDEDLGWIEIHHYDDYMKDYYLSPRKGGAVVRIVQ